MELIKHKKILPSEELLDRLKKENWGKLVKQLHYYSLNRLKRFPHLEERFNLINLANHFADEAIRQLWMEERTWDTAHYPGVYDFLKSAVDSIRWNFLKSKETSATTFIDETVINTVSDPADDPQTQLETKELEAQVKEIFHADPEAYQVFDCLKNNMLPRNISTEMDIPVDQVYNAIKRIDRKLTELRKHITN